MGYVRPIHKALANIVIHMKIDLIYKSLVLVVARPKAQVCGRSPAENADRQHDVRCPRNVLEEKKEKYFLMICSA